MPSLFGDDSVDMPQEKSGEDADLTCEGIQAYFQMLHGERDVPATPEEAASVLPVASYLLSEDVAKVCQTKLIEACLKNSSRLNEQDAAYLYALADKYGLCDLTLELILYENARGWNASEMAHHMELAKALPKSHFLRLMCFHRGYQFTCNMHRIAMIAGRIEWQRRQVPLTPVSSPHDKSNDDNNTMVVLSEGPMTVGDERLGITGLDLALRELLEISQTFAGKRVFAECAWAALVQRSLFPMLPRKLKIAPNVFLFTVKMSELSRSRSGEEMVQVLRTNAASNNSGDHDAPNHIRVFVVHGRYLSAEFSGCSRVPHAADDNDTKTCCVLQCVFLPASNMGSPWAYECMDPVVVPNHTRSKICDFQCVPSIHVVTDGRLTEDMYFSIRVFEVDEKTAERRGIKRAQPDDLPVGEQRQPRRRRIVPGDVEVLNINENDVEELIDALPSTDSDSDSASASSSPSRSA